MVEATYDGGAARPTRRRSWAPAHFGHGLAIFDLDRTLIAGSSLVHLGRELVRRRVVPPSVLARHSLSRVAFERGGLGDVRVERLVRSLLRAVADRDAAPLADAAGAVGRSIASGLHPTARWLVDRHVDAGDFSVIVSASPHELVEGVVAALGMHRAVGTRLEVVDGRCTGRFDGPFCYGGSKLAALERELGHFDLTAATAYADSASDLPLLQGCGAAVAVNPDAGLRRAAAERSWPVLRFG